MPERTLRVTVIGDDRDLQRMFDRQGRQISGFERRFGSLGQAVRSGLAGAGIAVGFSETIDLVRGSVNAASDLNEQTSRTQIIMGDAAAATLDWSKTTATAFGISQRAALTASATFAGLFQTVGVDQERAAGLSQALVQLAADLASLQNSSPEEALVALRSGLAGESEPLRRFNIFLSETRVTTEALAASGKTNARELTNQEKALARYTLIMRDSVSAQGNFAQTSDQLANQSRILRAQFDDLQANMGGVLIPVLTDATRAANALFTALDRMRGVDFSPGFDFPDPPSWLSGLALAPVSPLAAGIAVGSELLGDEEKKALEQAASPGRGIGEAIAAAREAEAKEMAQAAAEVKQARTRAQKAFGELVLGLGLKLDKAQLTAGLGDDIAALLELEAAILRQIGREGKTFELVEQLTQTRLQLAAVRGQQSATAAAAARDAYQEIISGLDLQLTQALRTASLEDDLAVLSDMEQAIRRRISTEGRTIDLLRQLDDVQAQREQILQDQRERRRERRQGRQFEGLGLTETGDERIPGAGAQRRRSLSLEERIKGTVLDTEQNRQTLDRIQSVLSGKFGEVGRTVREAIERMLDEISGALEQGGEGPATKFQKRGVEQLIAGLGLSPEEIKALRQRFAQVGAGGTTPGSGIGAFGFGLPGGPGSAGIGSPAIDVHFTINIDGQEVEARVTRRQEKKRGRRATSRRGTRPGI